MPIVMMICGVLLALFGGGCTIASLIGMQIYEQAGNLLVLWLFVRWLLLGLAPMVGGFLLFQYGSKIDREKRGKAIAEVKPPNQDGAP